MNLKISSVQIICKGGNVFISFSEGISCIYGNTGVGKTTLLNLICYAFGNQLVKTQAVEHELISVKVTVILDGELLTLERKANSNSIFILSSKGSTQVLARSTAYNYNNPTISEYLYERQNIRPIKMLRRNSTIEIPVSFDNYLWFSYLKQDELDNNLFYFGDEKDNFSYFASTYVMKNILGNNDVYKTELLKQRKQLDGRKSQIETKINIANEFFSASNLFSLNLSKEIAKKLRERVELQTKLEEENITNSYEIIRKIGHCEKDVVYMTEISKIKDILSEYQKEYDLCGSKIKIIDEELCKEDNGLFDFSLKNLAQVFLDCLHKVHFSFLDASDTVWIDPASFIPCIVDKYRRVKFNYSTLSSGGKKTIFKICYAISIHIVANKLSSKTLLPNFLIIDTPMKNISEREDRELFDNLYKFFNDVFSKDGMLPDTQLIIVDKELSEVLHKDNVMVKRFSVENPLFPGFNIGD